jgi:flagellar hook assembly protein FlgD
LTCSTWEATSSTRAVSVRPPAGTLSLQWNSANGSGASVPAGNYQMRVTALAGNKAVDAQALTLSQVVGVTDGASSAKLTLANGSTVGADGIRGVFRPLSRTQPAINAMNTPNAQEHRK